MLFPQKYFISVIITLEEFIINEKSGFGERGISKSCIGFGMTRDVLVQ
jgi:hypothetical protein